MEAISPGESDMRTPGAKRTCERRSAMGGPVPPGKGFFPKTGAKERNRVAWDRNCRRKRPFGRWLRPRSKRDRWPRSEAEPTAQFRCRMWSDASMGRRYRAARLSSWRQDGEVAMFKPQPVTLRRGALCLEPLSEADLPELLALAETNAQHLVHMSGPLRPDWYRQALAAQRDG